MSRSKVLWTVIGISLALITLSFAAELDYGPVTLSKVDQCQRAQALNLGPAPEIQSLVMNKPTILAALSSWVTSNMMADDFATDSMWYEFEQLRIMGMFYAPRARTIRATIQITDMNNDVVEAGVARFTPDPSTVMYVSLDTGDLPPGFYRARVTYKQGNRTAGSEYWFTIVPAP